MGRLLLLSHTPHLLFLLRNRVSFIQDTAATLYGREFSLAPTPTLSLPPKSWSGHMWARTLCSGASPGNTLAEFTLNGADGLDFYDVSLVDRYNLPVLVVPHGGCSPTGCLVDLNDVCPDALRVMREGGGSGSVVACRSACEAFGEPQFCCSEAFATPDMCALSVFSLYFKHVCLRVYSYAYDDKASTYTCSSADYIIIFCPEPYTSQKVLGLLKDGALLPLVNETMMYL